MQCSGASGRGDEEPRRPWPHPAPRPTRLNRPRSSPPIRVVVFQTKLSKNHIAGHPPALQVAYSLRVESRSAAMKKCSWEVVDPPATNRA
jgi:hypothetical protein